MYVDRLVDAGALGRAPTAERVELFAAEARRVLLRMRVCAWLDDCPGLAAEALRLRMSAEPFGAVSLACIGTEIERHAAQGSTAGMEGRVEYAFRVLAATRLTLLDSPLFRPTAPCSNMGRSA